MRGVHLKPDLLLLLLLLLLLPLCLRLLLLLLVLRCCPLLGMSHPCGCCRRCCWPCCNTLRLCSRWQATGHSLLPLRLEHCRNTKM